MERWAKIILNDKSISLVDYMGMIYKEAEYGGVNTETSTVRIEGTDGVIPGTNTFAPFSLKLLFYYDGEDETDFYLMEQKLRGLLNRREPYYIIHSNMPYVKYAVNEAKISRTRHYSSDMSIEIDFNCYKGYGESLRTTSEFLASEDLFQFGDDFDYSKAYSYEHHGKSFEIYNGSSDTINPLMRHTLKITIKGNAPKGFKLINQTTGDVFEYKKALKEKEILSINGVYAYLGAKRCGIDTNHGVISLKRGSNQIKLEGEVEGLDILFDFPFIYR